MSPKRFELTIGSDDPSTACEVLAARTGLSKSKVKQAMVKGAVWQRKSGAKPRRVRRATMPVQAGERWILYYDPAVLELDPPAASCLSDYGHYSIWFKPAGLMTQGTRFGDHCALLRQVELHFGSKRDIYLVHRLDREAAGVLIIAHSRTAAARFSALFRRQEIEKRYWVWVRGDLASSQPAGRIELVLDGKEAVTEFEAVRCDAAANQTLVRVRIHTGRYHQIRRHFDMIGFPVMGDPRYGKGNKNKRGMQLAAYALSFVCPFGNGRVEVSVDPEKMGIF